MSKRQMQRLFDKAVIALIVQGEPAFEDGVCKYRAAGGLKCAIGHLIPDKRYQSSFEGLSGDNPSILTAIGAPASTGRMLERLQEAHDDPAEANETGAVWLASFVRNAEAVAIIFGLSAAVLKRPVRAEERIDG